MWVPPGSVQGYHKDPIKSVLKERFRTLGLGGSALSMLLGLNRLRIQELRLSLFGSFRGFHELSAAPLRR